MSPEQMSRGRNTDARSDVYSLGATMFYLLTLKRLPPSDSTPSSSNKYAKHSIPRRVDPRIPAELDRIVRKAIATEPDERYQTAKELSDDLQRYLDGDFSEPDRMTRRGMIASSIAAAIVGAGAVGWTRLAGPKSPAPWQIYDRSTRPYYAASLIWAGSSSLTMETWVQIDRVQRSVLLGQSGILDLRLEPRETGGLVCAQATIGDEIYIQAFSEYALSVGESAHLALTFDAESKELSIFVHGIRQTCTYRRLTYVEDSDRYESEFFSDTPKLQLMSLWPDIGLTLGGLLPDDGNLARYPVIGKMRDQQIADEVIYRRNFVPTTTIRLCRSTRAAYKVSPENPDCLVDVSGNEMDAMMMRSSRWID